MNPFSYDLQNRMVGEVVQSPINLETLSNGQWLLLDGRDMYRSACPELAQYFPAGVFTGTARTLNAAPVVGVIAADGTNFLAPGAAGTSPLQASADGITWSTSATWTAATSAASLIVAGSRYIMAGSGGDLTVPFVSTTGQTAANQVAKANWTATTVATTTALTQGLAYGSTANAGAGRTVMIPDAAGTTIWTLDDGATAWVARSHTTSRTKKAVVWTGQKFIIITTGAYGIILSSVDGVTWVEQTVPWAFNIPTTPQIMASDGTGNVVIGAAPPNGNYCLGHVLVSKDHGATWRKVLLPEEAAIASDNSPNNPSYSINFVNGKFIANADLVGSPSLISTDGLTWFVEPLNLTRGGNNFIIGSMAYKAGVYCAIPAGATTANTYTEDVSKLKLPAPPGYSGNSSVTTGWSRTTPIHNEYIKARSN